LLSATEILEESKGVTAPLRRMTLYAGSLAVVAAGAGWTEGTELDERGVASARDIGSFHVLGLEPKKGRAQPRRDSASHQRSIGAPRPRTFMRSRQVSWLAGLSVRQAFPKPAWFQ
jgi:hypothetical protein